MKTPKKINGLLFESGVHNFTIINGHITIGERPTSPSLPIEDIKNAIKAYEEQNTEGSTKKARLSIDPCPKCGSRLGYVPGRNFGEERTVCSNIKCNYVMPE